jgi:hypothetical protein
MFFHAMYFTAFILPQGGTMKYFLIALNFLEEVDFSWCEIHSFLSEVLMTVLSVILADGFT